jgi:hypothetical protein
MFLSFKRPDKVYRPSPLELTASSIPDQGRPDRFWHRGGTIPPDDAIVVAGLSSATGVHDYQPMKSKRVDAIDFTLR